MNQKKPGNHVFDFQVFSYYAAPMDLFLVSGVWFLDSGFWILDFGASGRRAYETSEMNIEHRTSNDEL
ncbi:MAG: hypothetical protein K9J81_07260 [Desulfohalobiaceae bacterium]|nr:hypothetical protein [Desulfohalobiaceae bacterium]